MRCAMPIILARTHLAWRKPPNRPGAREIESTSCAGPRTKPMPRSWPNAPWQERGSPVCVTHTKRSHSIAQGERDNPPERPYPEAHLAVSSNPLRSIFSCLSRQHADARPRVFSPTRACPSTTTRQSARTRIPRAQAKYLRVFAYRHRRSKSFCTIRPYLARAARNKGATSSMPSLSPFKVKHQILCHPGKLNGYSNRTKS